jgi:hypothetical protein
MLQVWASSFMQQLQWRLGSSAVASIASASAAPGALRPLRDITSSVHMVLVSLLKVWAFAHDQTQ